MAKLMVVEDLEDNFTLINSALSNIYDITWARSIDEATRKFTSDIDLALVDIGLPDGDGFQFCDWVRTKQHEEKLPIIFLSANNSVESRITGFSVGGDDYISKPFNFIELKTRIEAKLRIKATQTSFALDRNGIHIDLRSQKATLEEDGQNVDLDLTPIEFKILNLLVSEPNRVFSRDEILNNIWGKNIFIYPRSVDTHVSKLRSKMGSKASHIRSAHGIGYKYTETGKKQPPPSIPKPDSLISLPTH